MHAQMHLHACSAAGLHEHRREDEAARLQHPGDGHDERREVLEQARHDEEVHHAADEVRLVDLVELARADAGVVGLLHDGPEVLLVVRARVVLVHAVLPALVVDARARLAVLVVLPPLAGVALHVRVVLVQVHAEAEGDLPVGKLLRVLQGVRLELLDDLLLQRVHQRPIPCLHVRLGLLLADDA